jgi:predicted ABC-type ATPase
LALWCWEITNLSLLEPVSETQVKKARAQRLIVAKKIQQLHSFLELCADHTTYDSLEKVAKLNEEFQAYSRLGQKETTTEWIVRKRKH